MKGTASSQEEHEVREWLKLQESRKEFDSLMERYWEKTAPSTLNDVDYSGILDAIHKRMEVPPHEIKSSKRVFLYRGLRVAASLLLFMLCSYALFESYRDRGTPATDEIQAHLTHTRRTTGPGEKLTMILSDKTKVIINSESEISFSSDYGIKDRVITVKGEAFFDVASDPSRPFKVITEEVTTTALGTEFNVYSRNRDHRIALVEGKVAVGKTDNQIELTPGLMAVWNSKEGSDDFAVRSFDIERVTAWKEGNLVFDRKPFGDILEDLAAWYSVDIQIDKGVDVNKKVIGTFQNKNLEDMLTGLSFSLNFNFEINGKNVHVKNPSQ
ncbi:FecR domain-containing protein [Algoriphagus aestuariicola]|uniref:FecR domain-containing protein n=1 Tax=Algoriphagus aestuariicola TaxID=1852016 RepID=A0ABS3BLD2_9BACT|nr:FecR domain-containing protein [Algoriphagus aestuariicola]MBN7800087.1 FecR domain-containing protein [Algoriphagus aestuariicola]